MIKFMLPIVLFIFFTNITASDLMKKAEIDMEVIEKIIIAEDIAFLTSRKKNIKDMASSIHKYSKIYEIDYKIILAIFKVESNFNYKAINYASADFGIGQINLTNIKYYKIDLGLLLTNIDYAIKQTFIMLGVTKKSYKKKDGDKLPWFARYHSYTKKRRIIYYALLKVHLDALGFIGGF